MKKREEIKDKTRNNRFVAAFDYLRRTRGELTRLELAAMMGVSKDTITRIMHAYTPFTDDAITKFQTATGCIFNLQWLRGESDTMLANDAGKKSAPASEILHHSAPTIDQGSLMNATIAAQQTAIESLKRELADKEDSAAKAEASAKRELAAKDETIAALRSQMKDKESHIETLKQQIADLRAALALLQAKDAIGNYPFVIGAAEDVHRSQTKK